MESSAISAEKFCVTRICINGQPIGKFRYSISSCTLRLGFAKTLQSVGWVTSRLVQLLMVPLAQVTDVGKLQQQQDEFALPELEDLLATDFAAEGLLQAAHAFGYGQPFQHEQTPQDVRRTLDQDSAASKQIIASQLHSLLGTSASSIPSSPVAQQQCKDLPSNFSGFTSGLQGVPVRTSWTPEAASCLLARDQNLTCAGTRRKLLFVFSTVRLEQTCGSARGPAIKLLVWLQGVLSSHTKGSEWLPHTSRLVLLQRIPFRSVGFSCWLLSGKTPLSQR